MPCAFYDLTKNPMNVNAACFLAAAKAYGATHVRVGSSGRPKAKYDIADTARRLETIVAPLVDAMGMTWGPGVGGVNPGHTLADARRAWKETGTIGKFQSPRGTAKYTVTIRDYPRYPYRNSDRLVWMPFAEEIGAVVIDDFYKVPIAHDERLALYAGAEMNYFVSNGPAALCIFSDFPYRYFVTDHKDDAVKDGVGPFPWATDNQKIFWGHPTLEELRASHPVRQ